jgi:hypothetical protein
VSNWAAWALGQRGGVWLSGGVEDPARLWGPTYLPTCPEMAVIKARQPDWKAGGGGRARSLALHCLWKPARRSPACALKRTEKKKKKF